MLAKTTLVAAGLLTLVSAPAHAAVLPYRFDKIAEQGPGFSGLGLPALNDNGVAAFVEYRADGSAGVYFGNHFLVQRAPVTNVGPNVVDINNAGQIAYTDARQVYRADPAGVTTIGLATNPVESYDEGPVINNAGQVAYSTSGAIVNNLYRGDGTAPQTITHSTTGSIAQPRMNNAGKTAAISRNIAGTFLIYDGQGILDNRGFGSRQFTDPDFGTSGIFTSFNAVDVGDNDRVVFAARWSNLTDAFYLWENGTISKVAGTNGLTGVPAINDLGVVAGLVSGNGPERIAIFEGGVEGTIISVGWAFDGSTITGLALSPEGFNNLNQVAFLATLADGRTVNVISQLPEPGAAGALVFAAAGLLARRRRLAQ